MRRVLISTGDFSADIHAASLILELKKLDPSLHVTALGGIKLKAVSDVFLKDMVDLDVSGFTQPIKQFFNLKNILLNTVFPLLDPQQLSAVILVDYYGFNIRIAHKAKAMGIPVFYFVSPQVWASRRWRVKSLKKSVSKMLVIFPFEEGLYRSQGVPVEFVGHPLLDQLPNPNGKAPSRTSPIFSFMPGSRVRECDRHIPLMCAALERLQERWPNLKARMFAADNLSDAYYKKFKGMEDFEWVRGNDLNKRLESTVIVTASGTATLENALLGLPMVVVYQMSWLTYWLARWLIRVPYISMPNLLAKKELVPEFVQYKATPRSITRAIEMILTQPQRLEGMVRELIQLREQLGQPGAYARAAQSIYKSL